MFLIPGHLRIAALRTGRYKTNRASVKKRGERKGKEREGGSKASPGEISYCSNGKKDRTISSPLPRVSHRSIGILDISHPESFALKHKMKCGSFLCLVLAGLVSGRAVASSDGDAILAGEHFRMALLPRQVSTQNLQAFTGALGNVPAPPITNTGDPSRQFAVEGDTFVRCSLFACTLSILSRLYSGCPDCIRGRYGYERPAFSLTLARTTSRRPPIEPATISSTSVPT